MLQSLLHFLHLLFDPEGLKQLVQAGGPQLICGIVFIETGFFVGFFLPGDSLLFAAGALTASMQILDIKILSQFYQQNFNKFSICVNQSNLLII